MFHRLIVSAFCALFLLSPLTHAADGSGPQVIEVTAVTVRPAGLPGVERLAKAYVAAHRQLETERYYTTWRQMAGRPNQLLFARSFSSFGAMDEEDMQPLQEALGADEAAKLFAGFAAVEEVQTGIFVHNAALSVGEPAAGAPGQQVWLRTFVGSGQEQAFKAYLAKVAEATKKVMPDANYQTFEPVAGEPSMWVFAIPATFADMDRGPGMPIPQRLEKAFGEKEAERLLNIRDRAVTDSSMVIVKADPELSYWPDAPVASR